MSFMHVVNGDSAADVLSRALEKAKRKEPVICLHDDLAVGPLERVDDELSERATFWETAWDAPDGEFHEAFEGEAAALAELAASEAQVVVWHGHSAGDQLTLRRVAFHLRTMPQRLNEIGLTLQELDPQRVGPGDQTAVALYSPDILRARLPTIAPISVLRISRLALEWQELKRVNSDIRRLYTNTLVGGSFCELDALIVEHLSQKWQSLNRLVGKIMVTNTGFFATDTLIQWRIRVLHDSGKVAIRGDGPAREIAERKHSHA